MFILQWLSGFSSTGEKPARQPNFTLVNSTQEAEDAYDLIENRKAVIAKPIGTVATIAHMIKGALGSGLLSGHVAYMKAGIFVAFPLNILIGLYLYYCLYSLGHSAQILCKRSGRPVLSYAGVGEASMALFPGGRYAKSARFFGYVIDALLIIELFGACTTYQLIISKTIKQLVEDHQVSSLFPQRPGYPNFRVYMAAILIPCILLCLLRHLQALAPFSFVANGLILVCVFVTIYYAFNNNPKFEHLIAYTSVSGAFEMIGLLVFSMSCASQALSIENSMKNPQKYSVALGVGMIFIVCIVMGTALFGYVAYLDKCDAPITVNFPMTIFPKILKGMIAVMIFVTHALNFWVPFDRAFFYISKCHKKENLVKWEYFYRALFVTLICLLGIIFPSVTALMGFLGCCSLSNIAFIWPNCIELLVIWHRPGLGRFKWRLFKIIILLLIGLVLFLCGSVVSIRGLIHAFSAATP